jgi:alpha-beta hydrolase superfamily lysophospholipase
MTIRQAFLGAACLMILIHCGRLTLAQSQKVNPKEVTFKTEDGVRLYADIYRSSDGKKAPLVLLFHQGGGDARGEYSPLVPRLLEQGFNVMAIDQRSGGNRFGKTNRTVAGLKGKEFSYCEAYKDLEATLRYVKQKGFTGKRLAWGSSYSATLVIRLGSDQPADLAGILAFSPAGGKPMEGCKADPYIPELKLPALILHPAAEMQVEFIRHQFSLFQKYGHQTYIAENGVHGSSMLSSSRVNGDVEEHWKRVLDFIKQTLAR